MSRSIVCGVDDSAEARRAAEVTVDLAQALGADPILVHAVDKAPPQTAGVGPAHGADERVLVDKPANALRAVADETDALLVAVGSRGQSPLRSALFGSTSKDVLRQIDRPVMVVPPEAAAAPLIGGAVVCGVDGSPASDYAVAAAAALGERLNAELLLVAVEETSSMAPVPAGGVTPPVPPLDAVARAERERAQQALDDAGMRLGGASRWRTRVTAGAVAGQLVTTAEEEAAEMIVIGRSDPGPIEALLFGSVTSVLCSRAPCPVMIVPEGASLTA